ncbi:MAG: efflux RND transporter permease subunit, partial [Holophagales bacterium]|nr:efflux RND transporter permease subunit [Holophagales bacterium]
AGHPESRRAAVKVVEVPPGPPVLSTLVVEVYGPDEGERLRVARDVRRIFETTPGVVDVDWLVEAPQVKKILAVDREKAALHGVPAASIARALRLALHGEEAGLVHERDEVEPVTVRLELPRADRSSVEALARLRLRSTRGSATVPLSELVEVRESMLAPSRHRKNLRPVAYVVAEVAGEAESPVYAILDMSERLEGLELPAGSSLEQHFTDEPTSTARASIAWDGEWRITYEVFRDLGAAFGAVLILIYLLIVGWFGSFRVPLVMMIAIPLSLVGILPGHWLFGAFFTATSMIGFIALAGIMVRNSVLLIDFVELARSRGSTLKEAVLEAGSVRFRPILLTAGTVVVGAIVILFDPIFQGLAIALMFGALASTALTLIVVPLVYYQAESRAPR